MHSNPCERRANMKRKNGALHFDATVSLQLKMTLNLSVESYMCGTTRPPHAESLAQK